MREGLMVRADAAEYLGVTEGTLANWQSTGYRKVPHLKIGRRVIYRKQDLDAFIDDHVVNRAPDTVERTPSTDIPSNENRHCRLVRLCRAGGGRRSVRDLVKRGYPKDELKRLCEECPGMFRTRVALPVGKRGGRPSTMVELIDSE